MLIVRRAKSDFTGTNRVPFATGINASFSSSVFSEKKEAKKTLVNRNDRSFPKATETNSSFFFYCYLCVDNITPLLDPLPKRKQSDTLILNILVL